MNKLLSIINSGGINLNGSNLFAIHQALYWYCAENHEGQWDTLYSILSQSPYKPAPSETSADIDPDLLPFNFNFTTENAPYIWCAALLVGKANAEWDDDIYVSRVRAVEHLEDHYIVKYSDNSCRVYFADTDTLEVKDLTQDS